MLTAEAASGAPRHARHAELVLPEGGHHRCVAVLRPDDSAHYGATALTASTRLTATAARSATSGKVLYRASGLRVDVAELRETCRSTQRAIAG